MGPETALLLKVFPSNFRQIGFVASVEPGKLAELPVRSGGIVAIVVTVAALSSLVLNT